MTLSVSVIQHWAWWLHASPLKTECPKFNHPDDLKTCSTKCISALFIYFLPFLPIESPTFNNPSERSKFNYRTTFYFELLWLRDVTGSLSSRLCKAFRSLSLSLSQTFSSTQISSGTLNNHLRQLSYSAAYLVPKRSVHYKHYKTSVWYNMCVWNVEAVW